jgi:tetratricopeptide (TPR) repeat protein
MRIRGTFTGARLLDALGFSQKAERLLEEVVDRDIEHELYKDAFLDLLYLYGHHAKAGDLDKAAHVCRRALTDASLAAIAHDQLRTLWEQLLDSTRHQAISQELLRDLRQYLGAHWKHPADKPPLVVFS